MCYSIAFIKILYYFNWKQFSIELNVALNFGYLTAHKYIHPIHMYESSICLCMWIHEKLKAKQSGKILHKQYQTAATWQKLNLQHA